MTGTSSGETPHVGIFWLVQTPDGKARLLTAGCPMDQAEAYCDCLTYAPGHYETWMHWTVEKRTSMSVLVPVGTPRPWCIY